MRAATGYDRFRSSLAGALVLLAGGTLACGNPLVPGDVAGDYALRTVDGSLLPVVMQSGGDTRITLLADTLTLNADGTGVRIGVQTFELLGSGTGPEESRSERPIHFRIVRGRLEIGIICGPLELCTPPPHMVAWRTSEGLEAQRPEGGPILRYRLIINHPPQS